MASIKGEGRGKIVITSSEKGGREKYWKLKFEENEKGIKKNGLRILTTLV